MKSWNSALLVACGLPLLAARLFGGSPLTPDQERATFHLADSNLIVELAAAEPDVRAPVAIAWDADSRMFVAEMTDYPSGPVSGRIRMLEDRDGDGRYERSTIFATNLAFPNGVMPWRNGILVTAAPDIWFLADRDGDGVAELREKILTGFTEGNQQLRVNGLFWGIDNWIYGANGRSDGEIKWGDGTTAGSIRRHDFRFRPDTKQFEAVAGNSQFGAAQDDWGNRFPVFNNIPIRHVVLEERYITREPALAGSEVVAAISPTNGGNRVFAITQPNLLIPQPIGSFTSACGPSIFRGTALPQGYRGDYFVCEPVQNVVQRRVLSPAGATFIASYAQTNAEFLAASDPWFHGVFTATGPDGALYIVDFYRDLVEHPHWVAPELRDKVDWRKGEEHGRIWRVRAKGAKTVRRPKLANATDHDLVLQLESDNGWLRDTAHRLLFERNVRDAYYIEIAGRSPLPQSRVHALNLLAELGGRARGGPLDRAIGYGLTNQHPRVRETGARLAESRLEESPKLLVPLLSMLSDPDPRVRLQVACSVGAVTNERARIEALAQLAMRNDIDNWQALAIQSSLRTRPWMLLRELRQLVNRGGDAQLNLVEQLAERVAASGNAEDGAAFTNWVRSIASSNRLVVLAAFAGKASNAAPKFAAVVAREDVMIATNRAVDERVRESAVRLAALRPDASLKDFLPLLNRDEPERVQFAVARALIESPDVSLVKEALAHWQQCSRSVRQRVIAAAARRSESAAVLLDAVERQSIPLVEIDTTIRQTLQKSADPRVKDRATRLFASSVSPDREAVIARYRAALKLAGDRAAGAGIFEKNCTVCHQMQGVGAKVGPDLSGAGQQPRESLLTQILDPSRAVLPDFVAYNATTKRGDSYTGFIVGESSDSVTLRRPNEPDVTLRRIELEEFKTSGKSLMPDGLEAALTVQEMADVLEFLRRPDRTLFTQERGKQ
jgi:putative membrane-bound dehydrogenase-like protein